ncbi:hypothetical protein HYU23_04210 [Candidatus Woesearchaeota archaeon]|nr:hypothetical protein [Candidatus Woesearchaeota archaeon]
MNKLLALGIGVTTYVTGTLILNITATIIGCESKQIYSQESLEETIAEELPNYYHKKNVKLIPIFNKPMDYDVYGTSRKIDERTFEISALNRAAVRHELEHIFDGHMDRGNLKERKGIQKPLGYLLYQLYYEPKASLHALGIRI